ncbi:MAG TPA: hypothetical protein VM367_08645 [Pseudonocardia sp.]|nr:hypothetical protein [Pseudonocardia sp.]
MSEGDTCRFLEELHGFVTVLEQLPPLTAPGPVPPVPPGGERRAGRAREQ